jgi:methyl-accepting chemotaxis protein
LVQALELKASGREPGPEAIQVARRSGSRMTLLILGTIVLAFIVGPAAGILANTLLGITSYDAADVLMIFLINFSIGAMTANHCIVVVESFLRKPLESLGSEAIGDGEAYISIKARLAIAVGSALLLGVVLFTAAALGYMEHAELSDLGARFFVETGILALLVIAWGLGLVWTIAHNLTAGIRSIIARIDEITGTGGDLGQRAHIIRHDDVGLLASALNRFLAMLETLVGQTRAMAAQVSGSADALADSSGQAQSSVADLERSLAQVREAADSQSSTVAGTRDSIESVAASVEAVSGQVATQAGFVEQSSAAISEMAANITSVSLIASKADVLANQLRDLSREGDEALKKSVQGLRDLETSSRSVREIVGSIAKIASQTNLLAMNAAIEAAHAGRSGAGFAVVADEVRTLAESAARSSAEIVRLIKDMSERISANAALADRAGNSFGRIREGVEGTTELVRTIAASMSEQKAGADEILGSINSLIEATQAIRNLSADQKDRSLAMRAAMDDIVRASERILEAIQDEAGSTAVLARVVSLVRTEAERNRTGTADLAQAISRFRAAAQD